MKFITLILMLLILSNFVFAQEKGSAPDTVSVDAVIDSTKEDILIRLPTVIAKEGDWLKFESPRIHGLTFIIPKADTLFADDLASIGFVIGQTKFLIFHLNPAEVRYLQVAYNANAGTGPTGKRYYYVVYYKGKWVEDNSSPSIIIEPGVADN